MRTLLVALLAGALAASCSGEEGPSGGESGGSSSGGSGLGGAAGVDGSAGGDASDSGGASGGGGSSGSGGGAGTASGPTRYPASQVTSPVNGHVAERLKAIAAANAKRQGSVFMKVGDSHTVSKNLMYCFAGSSQPGYQLELSGHEALLPSIQHFRQGNAAGSTPFDRLSLAAMVGKTAAWAIGGSPSPLSQETAALNPRFALVSYGTNDMQMGVSFESALFPFHENLSKLLDQLEGAGIVPIVAGLLPRGDSASAAVWAEVYDHVTRAIAERRQLPYLSVYQATKALPKQGLASDGLHGNVYVSGSAQPCVLSAAALAFNYNVRNLRSMEQLDVVRRVVLAGEQAPDATIPGAQGSGTPAAPLLVDALPFTHHDSTAASPSSSIDSYPGCNSTADESGPERHYRITVSEPTPVRAMLFDREGVDVDLHLLTGGSSGASCKARDDRILETTLAPGTHTFVVDSFVTPGKVLSGDYSLVIMRCAANDTCN